MWKIACNILNNKTNPYQLFGKVLPCEQRNHPHRCFGVRQSETNRNSSDEKWGSLWFEWQSDNVDRIGFGWWREKCRLDHHSLGARSRHYGPSHFGCVLWTCVAHCQTGHSAHLLHTAHRSDSLRNIRNCRDAHIRWKTYVEIYIRCFMRCVLLTLYLPLYGYLQNRSNCRM